MSQDGCHSSLITSSHKYIQIRKRKKRANRSSLICLFLIRGNPFPEAPSRVSFGQNWVKWLPLDRSQVQENRMVIIGLNQMWFFPGLGTWPAEQRQGSVSRKEGEMANWLLVTTSVWHPSIFKCLAQAPLLVFKIIVGGTWIKMCFQKNFSICCGFMHLKRNTHITNSSEPRIHGYFPPDETIIFKVLQRLCNLKKNIVNKNSFTWIWQLWG